MYNHVYTLYDMCLITIKTCLDYYIVIMILSAQIIIHQKNKIIQNE